MLHLPGHWLVAPRWQIIIELRVGRPLTRSLDFIAFVWNRSPPVFSPQTGRSTERLRFRVGLLKLLQRVRTVDPVELLRPLGSQTWRSVCARPSLDESVRTGRGLGSICRDLIGSHMCKVHGIASEPVFPRQTFCQEATITSKSSICT